MIPRYEYKTVVTFAPLIWSLDKPDILASINKDLSELGDLGWRVVQVAPIETRDVFIVLERELSHD